MGYGVFVPVLPNVHRFPAHSEDACDVKDTVSIDSAGLIRGGYMLPNHPFSQNAM